MKQKYCSSCKTMQPVSNYHRNKSKPDCKDSWCKTCRAAVDAKSYERRRDRQIAAAKEWKRVNPDKYRDYLLRKTFGITLLDYNRMFDAQGGVCAICSSPPGRLRLAVDHCHDTLEVRGLLCVKCNTAIGMLKHDLKIIAAASAYLSKKDQSQNHACSSPQSDASIFPQCRDARTETMVSLFS